MLSSRSSFDTDIAYRGHKKVIIKKVDSNIFSISLIFLCLVFSPTIELVRNQTSNEGYQIP